MPSAGDPWARWSWKEVTLRRGRPEHNDSGRWPANDPPWRNRNARSNVQGAMTEVGALLDRTLATGDDTPVRDELLKTTGDGILATFDSPMRAIRCAVALAEDVRALGIEIRAGLHTGEIELRDGDVGGIGDAPRRAGDGGGQRRPRTSGRAFRALTSLRPAKEGPHAG